MPKQQATQLERAAQSFYLDCEVRQLTPSTVLWYRKYVGALLTWLDARDVTTSAAVTLRVAMSMTLPYKRG